MKMSITHYGESLAAVIMVKGMVEWRWGLENYIYVHSHTWQMIYIFVFIGWAIGKKNEIGCALSILLPDQIRWYH